MKIATWNVNGIRAREAQLREWIERDRPDVVCLQEIKASAAQVPAATSTMATTPSAAPGPRPTGTGNRRRQAPRVAFRCVAV